MNSVAMEQNGTLHYDQYIYEALVFATWFLLTRYCIQLWTNSQRDKVTNLPPGPRAWPLIGNILQLGSQPHVVLSKLAFSSYRDGIMTVYIGPMRAVILSDMKKIKDAMIQQADCFSDRQLPPFLVEVFTIRGSVIWENGENWRQHRRMIHSAFRKLGYREKRFQIAITSEMEALCACLEEKTRENTTINDLGSLLISATANVICTVCFAHRYKYDDSEFVAAVCSMLNMAKSLSGISFAHIIPKLYHTPLYSGVRRDMNEIIGFIKKNIQEHKESFDPNNIRDVIDIYLCNQSSMATDDVNDICWRGIFDLFTAGSETTADSLLWAILYMVIYSGIQDKVQEELDSVFIEDEEDLQYPGVINRLPFTYATLLEIHRHVSVTPLSVPRVTSRDTTLAGYDIPKGTSVWVNEHAVHNDPHFWRDPEVFRPSRFLDSSGKHILREKKCHLVLFGYGLRQCLGRRLAEMENFMLFSGLLRKFTFRTPPEGMTPSTVGTFGLTYTPSAFPVVVERR